MPVLMRRSTLCKAMEDAVRLHPSGFLGPEVSLRVPNLQPLRDLAIYSGGDEVVVGNHITNTLNTVCLVKKKSD